VETLTSKVGVVTGGANGLGFGLAQAFGEERMRLVLADIDTEQLATAVERLRGAGVEVIGVPTDVADAAALERLRDATFERFGTAHVLCNNAGIGARGPLTEPIEIPMWRHVFDVDFYSILHGIHAFLPRMLQQGEGHIVNTSSRQGLVASPLMGPYAPAKHASVALTEMLHTELAEIGSPVGATVLTPGGVLTTSLVTAHQRHERGEETDPVMREFLATRVARAVEPLAVGRLVVRAIRARALYVNTHRETLDWLRARVDRMVADADALGTLM
jgi:NAD(P)-dependent dehydrogenase (short-subunit alcohol dehydrogenase family)